MSRMSKKLINVLSFILLLITLSFQSISQSSETLDKVQIENWIEDVPILYSLVKNKRDVVEFDSSNGKIISISIDSKGLQKSEILSFYNEYFEDSKWEKHKDKSVWEIKGERFEKKIFKIENTENNNLKIKIIVENF